MIPEPVGIVSVLIEVGTDFPHTFRDEIGILFAESSDRFTVNVIRSDFGMFSAEFEMMMRKGFALDQFLHIGREIADTVDHLLDKAFQMYDACTRHTGERQ